jgi:ankyrin repeat protein
MTPLHRAAMHDHTEIVDLLLKNGASLTAQDIQVIKSSVKLRQSNIKLL